MVLNCWRTSSTMARAALPTLFIVMLLNQYGSMAPISRPANTCARVCTAGQQQSPQDEGGGTSTEELHILLFL